MKSLLLTVTLCCAGVSTSLAGTVAFSVSASGQFGVVDLGTGAFSLIGAGMPSLIGLGQSGSTLYAMSSTGELVTIDPSTGATTPVASLGINASAFAAMSTGALYAVDKSWNLYSINPSIPAANLVGAIQVGSTPFPALGPYGYADSLAGNGTNLFFTLDLWSTTPGDVLASQLYSVDPLTGAATVIGPTLQEDLVGSGLVAGTLYAFSGSFVNPAHQIFTLDTSTGAATFVANVEPGAGVLYSATGPVETAATPEPGTLSLGALALGLMFGAVRLSHRRSRR
jgi:hypothetical protein